jgi:hypothetical protein
MTRRQSLLTQTDLAKVLRAVLSVGLNKNVRVEIAKDGSIALTLVADGDGPEKNDADEIIARLK